MAIRYFEEGVNAKLKDRRKLSTNIKSIIDEQLDVKVIDINYIFCDDNYLHEKNVSFLNHDTLTDIITFDLSETIDDLTAEIYVSVDRVKENAEKFGVSYQRELHRVIFHGVLHLCGFKDKSDDDAAEMRKMEDQSLHNYFDL